MPNKCVFVRCYVQNLIKKVRTNLVWFSLSLFSKAFVEVQVVQPDSITDKAKSLKNPIFISSERSNFHIMDNLLLMQTIQRFSQIHLFNTNFRIAIFENKGNSSYTLVAISHLLKVISTYT